MRFEPIAIVGRACLLPGASNPDALWSAVHAGRDLLTNVPPGYWRMDPALVAASASENADDRTWTDRGGYVRGFSFDPDGFDLPPEELLPLDPLFHWVLHTARAAFRDAGCEGSLRGFRAGAVLGNLSYPCQSLSCFAESVWLDSQRGVLGERGRGLLGLDHPHPRNRFMSGLPAHVLAQALNLEAGAASFALDAACASSLYAIKLACDRLQDQQADVMLAGGVNRADDLFIHIGFCALQAMSRTGQSRPFHCAADGLVPAEGVAMVVLRRLQDALKRGDLIHGVIRSIGLSNDGRGSGLLVPDASGQERAMEQAYALSGLQPGDVSMVECHATGTTVGDGVEVRSMSRIFQGLKHIPIGSLKSNLGHLITASGAAGLIKVLAAMDAGVRPATLHVEQPLEALNQSPFRLLTVPEPWECNGPRIAAINNFGFGGNNAHLLVEEPPASRSSLSRHFQGDTRRGLEVAIVGVQALVADGEDVAAFSRALFKGDPRLRRREDGTLCGLAQGVSLPLMGLKFPPADLDQTLPQQLFILKAAMDLMEEVGPLPGERTAVLVGMQCDAEVGRYGARWRMPHWVREWSKELPLDQQWLRRAREKMGSPRRAAGVVGAMPNIPANRICSQLDFSGPGFTVSAEELSGTVALELAIRALQHGEVDAALVGAVDMCCEPVHEAAAREVLGPRGSVAGDAAVMLVLKRLDTARQDNDTVWAVIQEDEGGDRPLKLGTAFGHLDLITPLFGHAHAASGLLHVAAAALCCRHRVSPPSKPGNGAEPWLATDEQRTVQVSLEGLGGQQGTISFAPPQKEPSARLLLDRLPRLYCYSGQDPQEVLHNLRQDHQDSGGPARLVLVASSQAQLRQRRARAETLLQDNASGARGVYFRPAPLQGELAFVFTGPAGSYPGMGRDLLLALPALREGSFARNRSLVEAVSWVYQQSSEEQTPHQKLWGSSFLSQVHAALSQEILGLKPQAALGFCSGETNALFALGAWQDMDELYQELNQRQVFTRQVGGKFNVVNRAWQEQGLPAEEWQNWRLLAPMDEVQAALDQEPLVHLTIINAPGDVIIGGPSSGCERVRQRIGRSRAFPLGYDVSIHCPEMERYAGTWRDIHHRHTNDVPGVRFYTASFNGHYQPTADSAADALTGMAQKTVDFPALVRRAYGDGVRIFLEHGPRDGCSKWIHRILDCSDHLAVSLDVGGRSSLHQAIHASAQLLAAGVPVDHQALMSGLKEAESRGDQEPGTPGHLPEPTRFYAAHPPQVLLPAVEGDPASSQTSPRLQRMDPPPPLPPVMWTTPASASPGCGGSAAAASPARRRLVSLASEHQTRVAAIHRQHLAQQAAVHQRFLQQRQQAHAGLLQACHAGNAPFPVLPPGAGTSPDQHTMPTPGTAPSQTTRGGPRGPSFSREQLEVLASGKISTVFGPLFRQQDGHDRQVRLPTAPLLLVDRVTGIDAEPGSMGKGVIWTETDIHWDTWYLNEGVMPAGIVVEAGQADLTLISYLGVDFLNKGERIYRLLGCDLTYHGTPPRAGETLCYEIQVDGHASVGDVRLFFFHYDCRVNGEKRLSVRNAQAGFFSDQELEESGGVLWDPSTAEHHRDGPLDPPAVVCERHRFSAQQVRAFSEGRTSECFGPGFDIARTHVRTPKIQSGQMLLLQEVTDFEPRGGPWGRGYLRVRNDLSTDDWYLQGHFHNDPCMPGTLMCEGCLQAMAFFLTAMGYTLERDGWRFDPVPDETYKLRCRGQVTPSSRELVYEVFVEEVTAGPVPVIFADILGTADGLKIFHGRRMGLRLVPDWPLSSRPRLLQDHVEPKPVARVNGFEFGYASLLACAWGRPSDAFGELGRPFDGPRNIARLPGPPYHFMSRVTRIEGEMGQVKSGACIDLEYDIPEDAWYFSQNPSGVMPFCVLLEAALQPCGWLAVFIGCPGISPKDLHFRNLDGTGTVHRELLPASGTMSTRTRLKSVSKTGDMILVSFELESSVDGQPVFTLHTGFGFFPGEALAQQVGIPCTAEEQAWLDQPSDFSLDLKQRPSPYFEGQAGLPGPMLLMLDRVTGYWPDAGEAGLGRLRAEKDVDLDEWFFKAHFYRDPVQPGSLGLEAMVQLLQFHMLHRGMHAEVPGARFEPIALGRPLTWKYRGQVTPLKQRIVVELEITEAGEDEAGPYALAEGWLWVDGLRIYQAKNLGLRVVGHPPKAGAPVDPDPAEEVLDPLKDRWLQDHRPNYTLPTLPLMCMVDRMASAALACSPAEQVLSLKDVQVKGWLVFNGPRRLRLSASPVEGRGDNVHDVTLQTWRDARRQDLSRFEPVASCRVLVGKRYPAAPAPLPPLTDAVEAEDPYAANAIFHGPSFQVLKRLKVGRIGYSASLDAGAGKVPDGLLNQALLDGCIHGILPQHLQRWCPEIRGNVLPYPVRITWAHFHGPTPLAGEVQCEVRFAGFDGGQRFPAFRIQLLSQGRVWAELRLIEVLVPMGRHGHDRHKQIAFLRDHQFLPGVGLSRFEGQLTHLNTTEVKERDWLRGGVSHCYGVSGDLQKMTIQAVIKDHVAQQAGVHPSTVSLDPDGESATCEALPLTRFSVGVTVQGNEHTASNKALPRLDLSAVRSYGRQVTGAGRWLGEEITLGLCRQFVRRVVLADPRSWEDLRGRSVIYLGNHQVQVESMMFPVLVSALSGVHIATIARIQHRDGWVGQLSALAHGRPGVQYPREIIYFDQQDPKSMFGILEEIREMMTRQGHSMFVHVEGRLARTCRAPVEQLSSVFLDLARDLDAPLVPVRFVGGLPVEELEQTLDFPLGYGQQDIYLGAPILPQDLEPLPYAERRDHVVRAMNALGPPLAEEVPLPADSEFRGDVEKYRAELGAPEPQAVVLAAMARLEHPLPEAEALLRVQAGKELDADDSPDGQWLEKIARWLYHPQSWKTEAT